MFSKDVESRVEDLERDLEQLARTVQVLDEPTGHGGLSEEAEDKIQELSVDVEGVEAGLEVVKMHMRRFEKRMQVLERLQLLESTARADAASAAAAQAAGAAAAAADVAATLPETAAVCSPRT